ALLYRILQDLPIRCVYALVRGSNPLERLPEDLRHHKRLIVITGDVTLPKLGMDPAVAERVEAEVDIIIHSPAYTSMHQPLPSAVQINVRSLFYLSLVLAPNC